MIASLVDLWRSNVVLISIVALVALALTVWGASVLTRRALRAENSAWMFYVVAVMSTAVSADTSWRFFGEMLNITETFERAVMFTVMEVALIACAYAMRANVRKHDDGQPGAPRMVAWALCGFAGFAAFTLSGPVAGLARVALGPVLGVVALHLALGIEIRHSRNTEFTGTLARVLHELRERALSRLGLANDQRDALSRTRDRAARRAAGLAVANKVPFKQQRLRRALRISNVAHDPAARDRMLAELAMLQHASELAAIDQPSPWSTGATAPRATSATEAVTPDATRSAPTVTEPSQPVTFSATPDAVQTDETATSPAAGEPRATPVFAQRNPETDTPAATPRAANANAVAPAFATAVTSATTQEQESVAPVATGERDVTPVFATEVATFADRAEQTNVMPALDHDTSAAELAEMSSAAERVRYAASVLDHTRPSEIVTWLAGHGYEVSPSNARVVLTRHRDKAVRNSSVVRFDGKRHAN